MRRLRSFGAPLALLFAAAANAGETSPATRLAWADDSTNLLGLPSRDGRVLSYVDAASGDLALYEIATGDRRRLTRNRPDAETFAYFSAVSPDSQRVAYAWFNEEGFYELRVVDAAGGETRTLYRNPEIGFVQPCDWSPDGESVLTLFFRKDNVSQVALVSAVDGSTRVLKTLSWFYPKKMSFSPDGRWILYDSIVERRSSARDILLLRADGGVETKLVEHPADDQFPLWAPDGRHVVFASNRSGDMDLWLLPVADGAAAGEPRRVARALGRALPMGVTAAGEYFYGLRTGGTDVFIADFDPAEGDVSNPARAGRGTLGRNSNPAWSPDGRALAFVTRLGTENYGRPSPGIVVWAIQGGAESVLVPRLAEVSRLEWAPDGASLAVSGSDGKGRSGLFQIDLADGSTRPLVHVAGGDPSGFEGVWTPDGDALDYIENDPRAGPRIRRRSPADGAATTLHQAEAGLTLRALTRSPDGRWLAFAAERSPDGPAELRLIPTDGGEPRVVMTVRNASISGVEWRRDGKGLWATTPGKRGALLWAASLDGRPPRKASFTGFGEGSFRLSPDGGRAAYHQGEERAEIWMLTDWLPREASAASSAPPPDAASQTPPSAP